MFRKPANAPTKKSITNQNEVPAFLSIKSPKKEHIKMGTSIFMLNCEISVKAR